MITDRPVAPWPCHKPDFSNFGSASPKWHSHAEPQRTQFPTGGSSLEESMPMPTRNARLAVTLTTGNLQRSDGEMK